MRFSIYSFLTLITVPYISGTISDLRLCGDPECRVPLSRAVASVRYRSIEPLVLSFQPGDEVVIFSKDAGINKELWGAEIRGQRGYIPKRFVREMQVFVRQPTFQVPTELPPSSASVLANTHQFLNSQNVPNHPNVMQTASQVLPKKPTVTTTTTSTATPELAASTSNEEEIPASDSVNTENADLTDDSASNLDQEHSNENVAESENDDEGFQEEGDDDGDDDTETDPDSNPRDENEEDTSEESDVDLHADAPEISDMPILLNHLSNESESQVLEMSTSDGTVNDTPVTPPALDPLGLPKLELDSGVSSFNSGSLEQDVSSSIPVVPVQSAAPQETTDSSVKNVQSKDDPELITLGVDLTDHQERIPSLQDDGEGATDDSVAPHDADWRRDDVLAAVQNAITADEVSAVATQTERLDGTGDIVDEKQNEESTDAPPVQEDLLKDSVEFRVDIAEKVPEMANSLEELETSEPASAETEEPQPVAEIEGTSSSVEETVASGSSSPAETSEPGPAIPTPRNSPFETEAGTATVETDSNTNTPRTNDEENEAPPGSASTIDSSTDATILDKALSWLGLSETDEPLKAEDVSETPLDATTSTLQEQIASMDPSTAEENPGLDPDQSHDQYVTKDDPALSSSTPNSEDVNGYCHRDGCGPDVRETEALKPFDEFPHESHDHHHHSGDYHEDNIPNGQQESDEARGSEESSSEVGVHTDVISDSAANHEESEETYSTTSPDSPVEVSEEPPIPDHSSHDRSIRSSSGEVTEGLQGPVAIQEHSHEHSGHDHSHEHNHEHNIHDHSSHEYSGHDHSHEHNIHDHSGHDHSHEHSGHDHSGHDHSHDHSGHDHNHDHSGHDHNHEHNHGHGHSHGHGHGHSHGHGHGHSHTPGYIPGFRHHYKPPVDPPQEVTTPSPAESLPTPESYQMPGTADAQPSAHSNSESTDYLSAEEIFRQAEEEQKRKMQAESDSAVDAAGDVMSWLVSLLSANPYVHNLEGAGFGTSGLLTVIVAFSVVTFLTLYYCIQKSSRENALLAKISQLDAQLYESQVASEEFGTFQVKIKQQESKETELKSLNDQLMEEKGELEVQLIRLKREKENVEKELESATESALELNNMLTDVLASQGESIQLQKSVEVLQEQLSHQELTLQNLKANLQSKTAENELLQAEVEELRDNSEKYQIRLKTLQADMETLKTSNRNYLQKLSQEESELLKLKQERDGWISERRSVSGQLSAALKETVELRDKVDQLSSSIKSKDGELRVLSECLERLSQTNNNSSESSSGNSLPNQHSVELSSLLDFSQLKAQLSVAHQELDQANSQIKTLAEKLGLATDEKSNLEKQNGALKEKYESAIKDKQDAETRLEVLSNYFKAKEAQLQKELGTQEAKRAQTEENVSETVKKMMVTEENVALYKSQVDTMRKEIEEQERSYKSRLAAQEKRAHESWVAARQLERRLEEAKQEAAQLRNRLIQVEKEKEAAVLAVKENGTNEAANGAIPGNGGVAGPDAVDLLKPVAKRSMMGPVPVGKDEVTILEHPPLLSPPGLPPAGMELPHGAPPPFDGLFPPPHLMPPVPFMPEHAAGLGIPPMFMPPMPPPPSGLMGTDHRPPPLGMISSNNFDVDYRREPVDRPLRRYGRDSSPPRRYPSPIGSERSTRSDRSDLNQYDDYRPMSPYGRHGGGRPRSVGRSRDPSPDRPNSYSPLPSPLYPPGNVHSPDDWEDRPFRPHMMMRAGSLRHPPGPKTSSPLTSSESGDPQQHRHRQLPPH